MHKFCHFLFGAMIRSQDSSVGQGVDLQYLQIADSLLTPASFLHLKSIHTQVRLPSCSSERTIIIILYD